MKRVVFLLFAVFSVIGGCYYLVCNKPDDEGFKFSSFFGFSNETGILPVSKWEEILVGRWNQEENLIFHDKIVQILSEVNYEVNGNFKTYYTIKIFGCNAEFKEEHRMKPNCLRAIFGGHYSGLWHIDTLKMSIKAIICNKRDLN